MAEVPKIDNEVKALEVMMRMKAMIDDIPDAHLPQYVECLNNLTGADLRVRLRHGNADESGYAIIKKSTANPVVLEVGGVLDVMKTLPSNGQAEPGCINVHSRNVDDVGLKVPEFKRGRAGVVVPFPIAEWIMSKWRPRDGPAFLDRVWPLEKGQERLPLFSAVPDPTDPSVHRLILYMADV